MTLNEKAAYIKGLADGLELDNTTKEGKLIAALIDIVGELTDAIYDIDEDLDTLNDYIEEIDEDLGEVEEIVYDIEDDCDCDCDCDCDDEYVDQDAIIYEVKCACGKIIQFDDETLEEGSIICPDCGENLEFVTEDEDELDD